MSNSTLQLALEIALQTKNLKELDLLMDELKAAGVDVTNLTEESAKLAKQFGELEQKQALITQFRELKKATSEANTEWQAAQAATAAYTSQIQDAKDSLEALEVAMRNQGEMSAEEARATQAEYNAMVREIRNLEQAQADQATRASQLSTQYDDLNSRLIATRSAMHDVGLSTTGLNAQQQALARESQEAQTALGELTAEAERLNAIAQARVTLGIDTDDNARRQIEEVTAAYETLRNSGTLSNEENARAAQLHRQRVAELEATLEEAKPTLEDIAGEFGKVTAAAGGLAYVTKAAMDFETAMVGVKKVVEGTPEQINQLGKEIQEMSVQLGMGSDAVAEIAALGGGLGVPIDKLGEFTKMAGQMSVAFNMSAEETGNAAAKLATIFDIPIEQVGSLGDAINTLGNKTSAKEPEIVDAMMRIGGTAKQFGLASEQAAALSAAFISLGKTPEVAGTAINGLLTKLMTANVQGDDFKNTLANMGISAERLAKDIHDHPQTALTGFLTTLKDMDSQQRSVATFKLFGQEYSDDVNVLVGALGSYNDALGYVSDKSATAGAMQKEFTANMSSSEQSINQAKQSINVLAETVGKELLPVVAMGGKAIGGITQAITGFAESHPILTKVAVLIAGAQVAMIAFSSAMNVAGMMGLSSGANMVTGFTQGAGAVNLATAAVARLDAALVASGAAMRTAAGGISSLQASSRSFSGDLKGFAGHMVTLNGLFAAAAGWTIGTTIGDSLYENSENARSLGDALASIRARIESLATTGSLDKFNQNFQTSAESARQAAEAEKKHAASIEGKTEALIKANEETKKQEENQQKARSVLQQTEEQIKSLTTQLTVMKDSGQENTKEYTALEAQLAQNKQTVEILTEAGIKSVEGTKEQTKSNIALANSIKLTEANLEGMKNRLAQMEADGQKDSQAYRDLSAAISETSDKLALLKAEANKKGIGELLKTDLDKASASFEALGLDMDEFATGIDSKTNAALTAFVEVAHLAEGDTRKLALAYNAAKDAAGDNQAAQAELNNKLNQVTEGNTQLAEAVKKTAKEQKEAKSASEEQAAALDKLGISMEAANAGMSKGGAEMVQTLKSGITAIKEQATSADALKTSLQQAFSQSIDSAKTKADFVAIKKSIDDAGVASSLTAEQVKLLNAGITGGAESAKKAKDEIDKETKALTDNASASETTANAKKQVADANRQVGDTAKEAAEKDTQSSQTQVSNGGNVLAMMQNVKNAMREKIAALEQMGVTAAQTDAIMSSFMSRMEGRKWLDFGGYAADMANLNADIERQVEGFTRARDAALSHTQALSGQDVTLNDLADAELALYHAQQANIEGMARMDSSTLDNLKRQIDSARERLDDLANSAKATADGLEANLARLKGDDTTARQIEQTRKLTELQDKLNEAQKRGNSEEISQLQRAIELQKQYNAEESRQADIKKQQEQQRKADEAQKQSQPKSTPTPAPTPQSSPTPSTPLPPSNSDGNVYASAKLVASEIARLKKDAIDEFMRVLQDEIKRQAR